MSAVAFRVLVVVSTLVLGAFSAHAEPDGQRVKSSPALSSLAPANPSVLWGAAACAAADGSDGSDCLVGRAVNDVVLPHLTRLASARGQALFGEHFRIASRLSWSPGGSGFDGDIDVVFPVSFAAARGVTPDRERPVSRALFLQWGVTRWSDDDGTRRDDVRYGVVRRFALSDAPGSDVLGLSALFQQGLERGHGRFVAGIDYAGAWGSGWLHHFMPATGWRPGRFGYEERARAGTELGVRLRATSTIAVETALTRWEDADGSGRWTTGAWVGLRWRPHRWLSFHTAWADTGVGEAFGSVRVVFSMPLGGVRQRVPRWEGLGVIGGGLDSESNAPDIWRPIEQVGRLQVSERAVAAVPEVPTTGGDTAPRFTRTIAAQTYTVGTAIRPLTLPAATGGNGARRYRLTPTVPGLRFTASTRRLTGTPTRAGTYRMTYRVTDADANTRVSDTDTRTFTFTVQARGDFAPRFTRTTSAQTYTVGTAIRPLTLPAATGGNGARRYRLTPTVPGLRFTASTRRLTGTPTRAGTYRMTYRVTDADDNTRASDTDTRTFTITVNAAVDTACTGTVNIPDNNLRAAVKVALGISAGAPITSTEMARLTILRATGGALENLVGLECASGLSWLELWGNQISDLTPLSGLRALRVLHLNDNRISDLTPMSGFTALEWLALSENPISDLTPLSGLTGLSTLVLGVNQISDIGPLSGLMALRTLDLRLNPISDLTPLSGLTGLTSLHLGWNQISDVSPLSGLTSLEYLVLASNRISDIGPLVSNTGLGDGDTVSLERNPLSDRSLREHVQALRARGVRVILVDADWLD